MKLISSLSTRSGTVRPRLGRLLTATAVVTGAVVLVLPAQTAAAASPASEDCVDTYGPLGPDSCGRPGALARQQAADTRERLEQQAQDTRERQQEQAQATRDRAQKKAEAARRH